MQAPPVLPDAPRTPPDVTAPSRAFESRGKEPETRFKDVLEAETDPQQTERTERRERPEPEAASEPKSDSRPETPAVQGEEQAETTPAHRADGAPGTSEAPAPVPTARALPAASDDVAVPAPDLASNAQTVPAMPSSEQPFPTAPARPAPEAAAPTGEGEPGAGSIPPATDGQAPIASEFLATLSLEAEVPLPVAPAPAAEPAAPSPTVAPKLARTIAAATEPGSAAAQSASQSVPQPASKSAAAAPASHPGPAASSEAPAAARPGIAAPETGPNPLPPSEGQPAAQRPIEGPAPQASGAPSTPAPAQPSASVQASPVRIHPQAAHNAQAMQEIGAQIARHFDKGQTRFEIRLDPPELGRIEVRLEIAADGRLQASLTAERPETLELLQRDARQLEKSLADSGLKSDQGSLSFALKEDGRRMQGEGRGAKSYRRVEAAAEPAIELSHPEAWISLRPGIDLRV